VFNNKRGRYSLGEKVAVIYCVILGLLLIVPPLIQMSPLDDTVVKTFRLINPYLIKSNVIIFASWIGLLAWSLSYGFKSFIHTTIGFKDNESLFSFFLLLILTTAYIAIGDITLLLKSNVTYTIKLTNAYFITSLFLLGGILYTLRRGIIHAKRLTKASMMHVQTGKDVNASVNDDMNNLREHLEDERGQGGLF
jgi:hypothetical protein